MWPFENPKDKEWKKATKKAAELTDQFFSTSETKGDLSLPTVVAPYLMVNTNFLTLYECTPLTKKEVLERKANLDKAMHEAFLATLEKNLKSNDKN